MSKLQELKRLTAEYESAYAVYLKYPDNYQNYMATERVGINLFIAAIKLLPPLLANVEASQAVIKRWESRDWKAEPTAHVMNKLRDTLKALVDDPNIKP